MTWDSLTNLLSREFRNLRRMPVVSFGFSTQPIVDANDLRIEEARLAERVDGIVQDFARTRRWPALDEKERYFLRERIRFAFEYCNIAETTVKRPHSIATRSHLRNDRRRMVEWLLIDTWRVSGVLNWIEPLVIMTQTINSPQNEWELHISE